MHTAWIAHKSCRENDVSRALAETKAQNQWTNGGPALHALETYLRDALAIERSKCVVCVSNGTVALWAAVAALELSEGRRLRVATQSFTFPASAQGYLYDAQIYDVDAEGGLDLALVDPDQVDIIIVTNVFGNVVRIERYEEWCKVHKKWLLFDNAATPRTFYKGTNALNYGHASTLSFHHTKPLGFGEGGCVVIDNEFEAPLRRVLNFGIDNHALKPQWHAFGANYKMSDLAAAYIQVYIEEQLGEICQHQKQIHACIVDQVPNLSLFPNAAEDNETLYSCLAMLHPRAQEIKTALENYGVYVRSYYHPLLDTPQAKKFYEMIVCIPIHLDVCLAQADAIARIIREHST